MPISPVLMFSAMDEAGGASSQKRPEQASNPLTPEKLENLFQASGENSDFDKYIQSLETSEEARASLVNFLNESREYGVYGYQFLKGEEKVEAILKSLSLESKKDLFRKLVALKPEQYRNQYGLSPDPGLKCLYDNLTQETTLTKDDRKEMALALIDLEDRNAEILSSDDWNTVTNSELKERIDQFRPYVVKEVFRKYPENEVLRQRMEVLFKDDVFPPHSLGSDLLSKIKAPASLVYSKAPKQIQEAVRLKKENNRSIYASDIPGCGDFSSEPMYDALCDLYIIQKVLKSHENPIGEKLAETVKTSIAKNGLNSLYREFVQTYA